MQCNVMFAYSEIRSLNRSQHYAAFDQEGWAKFFACQARLQPYAITPTSLIHFCYLLFRMYIVPFLIV